MDFFSRRASQTSEPGRLLSALRTTLAIALGVMIGGMFAPVTPSSAKDQSLADQVDIEFEQTKRLLEAHRDEKLDLLKVNYDEEASSLEAEREAEQDVLDNTRDADRAALEAAHEARLTEIDETRDAALIEIDVDYESQAAAIAALYAELVVELAPEGMSADDLEDAFKAAERDVKAARDAELDALEAKLDADRQAADEAFDEVDSALEAEQAALQRTYRTARAALNVAESAALDLHEARTAALLEPLEAEKKYWKDERKHVTETVDVAYKPLLAVLKDEGKKDTDAYRDLENQRKAEIARLTALYEATYEEVKATLDEVQRQQEATEDSMKTTFAMENDALDEAFQLDDDDMDARIDHVSADYRALKSTLEDDHDVDSDLIKDTYEVLIDQLHDQYEAFADSVGDQESRLDRWRNEARSRANRVRGDDRTAESKAYEQARRTIDRAHDTGQDSLDGRIDSALDDAEKRYDQAVAQVLRSHNRNMNLAESEHFLLRERVRAFLASDQLVPLGEFYDPHSDPGSLFNVARRIKSDKDGYTGAGVQVALIDTGIVDVEGLRHSNVTIGPDFSFEDINPELRARDTNGHGTHLAGIIVASDAEFVAGDTDRRPERPLGVAPAAELVAIKAGASNGAVDVTQVIAAINWVIEANASGDYDIRVINLAFGTNGVQDYEIDPLSYAVERAWHAGIVVVVAAGNDGLDATRLTNPATNPYVIAVGAGQARNDHDLVLSEFSNGSAGRGVDVVAPGRSIVSLRNPGSFADLNTQPGFQDDALVRGSGTSQAAAVVTGIVALMLEDRPELTPDQVKWLLMDTAKQARHEAAGAGFVQAQKAINRNLPNDPAAYVQTWATSDGSGSVDAARGDVRVTIDGVVLEGEQDIFGNSWSGSSWSGSSWSGSSWSGSSWSGSSWSGSSWSGSSWSGSSWSGSSWSGSSWSGSSWSGNSWTGSSWSGSSWSGSSWSGSSWSSIAWGS